MWSIKKKFRRGVVCVVDVLFCIKIHTLIRQSTTIVKTVQIGGLPSVKHSLLVYTFGRKWNMVIAPNKSVVIQIQVAKESIRRSGVYHPKSMCIAAEMELGIAPNVIVPKNGLPSGVKQHPIWRKCQN